MKKVGNIGNILLMFLILISFSCKREEFSVTSLLVQPYITSGGTMGLSVYTDSNIPGIKIQMQVESPDKNLVWNLNAETVEYEGLTYRGSANITMPNGLDLPRGTWTVTFFCSDGRSSGCEFNVSYSEHEGDDGGGTFDTKRSDVEVETAEATVTETSDAEVETAEATVTETSDAEVETAETAVMETPDVEVETAEATVTETSDAEVETAEATVTETPDVEIETAEVTVTDVSGNEHETERRSYPYFDESANLTYLK